MIGINRSFIITQNLFSSRLIKNYSDSFISMNIDNYVIYISNDYNINIYSNSSIKIIIFGNFIFLDNPECDNIAKLLVHNYKNDIKDLYNIIYKLSGRYAILVITKNQSFILSDACNMCHIFYHKTKKIISNNIYLLQILTGDVVDPLHSHYEEINLNLQYGYPGFRTKYENIKILPPNFLLNINDMQIIRFFPWKKIVEIDDIDYAAEEIERYTRCQISTLIKRGYNIVSGLTAGQDSRITTALLYPYKKNITFYTYSTGHPVHIKDIDTSKRISRILDLNHIILTSNINPPNEYIKWSNIRGMRHDLKKTYMLLKYFQNTNTLCINSNLYEITYYWWGHGYNFYKYNITSNDLVFLYKRIQDDILQKIFNDDYFIPGHFRRCAAFGYTAADLHYWEHRCGCWASYVFSEEDIAYDTYNIINCRAILDIFLSFNLKNRINRILHKAIINRNIPAINNIPIN